MHCLPLFHRLAGQPVIVLGEGEIAAAKRRLVERAGGVVVGEEDTQARLAFVALDRPAAAAKRLRQRGILVNVSDRPDLCDFTLPSILERGPVLVAVSTGGASAGLAKALRTRLETILPQSLGQLAEALRKAKARLRRQWPDPEERRKQIDAALMRGGPLDPMRDYDPSLLKLWLDISDMTLVFGHGRQITISLDTDDPDDLTLFEARNLANADLIVHDPDIAPAILALARADAVRRLPGEDLPSGGISLTVILQRG